VQKPIPAQIYLSNWVSLYQYEKNVCSINDLKNFDKVSFHQSLAADRVIPNEP